MRPPVTFELPYRVSSDAARPVRALDRLDTALLYGLVALLVFAPLAFGAVEVWSQAALQIAAAMLLLTWGTRQAMAREILLPAIPALLPLLFVAAVVLVQLVFGVSAYRHATVSAALLYAAYAGVFTVAAHIASRQRTLLQLLHALTLLGFAVAVFALVQDSTSNGLIYWIRKPRFGAAIYGSYVNHNHYAGLMEMLSPIPIVLALREELGWEKRLMYTAAGAVMAATIFAAGSRAGMLAIMMEFLFVAGVLVFARTRPLLRRGFVVLGLAAALLLVLNLDAIGSRMNSLDDPVRRAVLTDSVRMIRERPVFGWGLGTFSTVYPKFRGLYTDRVINAAHNDNLQLLIETGVAGFAGAVWFVVVVFRRGWSRLAGQRCRSTQAAALAGMAGCAGLLTHSFFDFNLQVPANATMFIVMAAVAATAIAPDLQARSRREENQPSSFNSPE